MDTVVRFLDTVSEWTGRIFSWVIVPITLLVVLEVVLRRFLHRPTIWNFEVTKQLYGFYFMIVAAYTLQHGGHVAVDILAKRLGKRGEAILDILGYLLFFFPFCIIIVWQGFLFAKASWIIKERSWSVFAPPLYPIKTVVPVTGGLLLLQGFSEFLKRILILKGHDHES